MTSGYIILTLEFRKEGRRWTARCVELGTATFGRSFEEARTRLEEAVALHITTLEEVGERERFFKENGIRFYARKPRRCKLPVDVPCDERTLVQARVQPVPAMAPA